MISARPSIHDRHTSHRRGRPLGSNKKTGKAIELDPEIMKRAGRRFAASLAQKIRIVMDGSDISYRELASATGMSIHTVLAYRAGRKVPGIWGLFTLAKGLGCSMVDLLPDEAHLP